MGRTCPWGICPGGDIAYTSGVRDLANIVAVSRQYEQIRRCWSLNQTGCVWIAAHSILVDVLTRSHTSHRPAMRFILTRSAHVPVRPCDFMGLGRDEAIKRFIGRLRTRCDNGMMLSLSAPPQRSFTESLTLRDRHEAAISRPCD